MSIDRGSITSLPILETINSDISEYSATNVISITDGQLFIARSLFHLGMRPAIDSSLSVSRIGSSAQSSLISYLCAGLKNALTISRQSLSPSSSISFPPIDVHRRDYNCIDQLFFHFDYSSLNSIFYQHPLAIGSIESSISYLLLGDFIHRRLFIHHYYSSSFSING